MFKRLKQIRKDKKLTQREFAELLGTKRDAYASYETGRVTPALSFVKLVCSKFNVNEEWLLNGTKPIYISNSENISLLEKISDEYNLDNFQKKLIQKYLELTVQQKNAVKEFLSEIMSDEPITSNTKIVNNELSTTKEMSLKPAYEMTDEEIDEEVEAYRQQLILEKTQ